MKIILSESQIKKIVDEALRDEIPSYMSDIIQKRYSNVPDILDRDIPKHTDKIPNVRVEITNEELTNSINGDLVNHFTQNILKQFQNTGFYNIRHSAPHIFDELFDLIRKSLGVNVRLRHLDDESSTEKTDADYVKSIAWLYTKEFKLPTPESSDINNPIFGKNKSSFATFLKVSKKTFPELGRAFDELGSDEWDFIMDDIINDKIFVGLRQPIVNYLDNVKKLQTGKLYLYITDKPDDKLRMSLSRYYDSCQNLYSGGDAGTQYNKKLLSNVFDVNSKVAYLIYNTPFKDNKGNEHPFTSVARTIIRVNDGGGIMFDRVYPPKMEDEFYKIIEDETGLKNVGQSGDVYHYSGSGDLPSPYMDKYKLKNTNTDATGLNNPRILALSDVVSFNLKSLEMVSDSVFKIHDEEWGVSTYDEAIEETRDYLLHIFSDMCWEKPIREIIDHNLFGRDAKPIFDLLNADEDDFKELGLEWDKYGLIEFLNEYMDIHTYEDLSKTFKDINDAWVYRNIDFDEYIEYFGGEHEAMAFTLARYDGHLHEVGDYYVYKMD